MITERKWIDIVEQKSTGKTKVFTVVSKEEDMLGWIKWFGRWRKYAFFPEKETVFETDCLNDISAFLKELMDERKTVKEMRNIKGFGEFLNEGMNCNMVSPWWHYFNKLVESGSSRRAAAEMTVKKFPRVADEIEVAINEDWYDHGAAEERAKAKRKEDVFTPFDDEEYAEKIENAIKGDWFEKLHLDPDEFIMTGIYAFMDDDEPKWFVSFWNEDHFILKHNSGGRRRDPERKLQSKYVELIVVPGKGEHWPISVEVSPHGHPVMSELVWAQKEETPPGK